MSEELQKLHVEKQKLTDGVDSFEARFVCSSHLPFDTIQVFQRQVL